MERLLPIKIGHEKKILLQLRKSITRKWLQVKHLKTTVKTTLAPPPPLGCQQKF